MFIVVHKGKTYPTILQLTYAGRELYSRTGTVVQEVRFCTKVPVRGKTPDRQGINYQGLKSIILAFYRNSQWTNVCEAYVDNFEKGPSMEYFEIANRQR